MGIRGQSHARSRNLGPAPQLVTENRDRGGNSDKRSVWEAHGPVSRAAQGLSEGVWKGDLVFVSLSCASEDAGKRQLGTEGVGLIL